MDKHINKGLIMNLNVISKSFTPNMRKIKGILINPKMWHNF